MIAANLQIRRGMIGRGQYQRCFGNVDSFVRLASDALQFRSDGFGRGHFGSYCVLIRDHVRLCVRHSPALSNEHCGLVQA